MSSLASRIAASLRSSAGPSVECLSAALWGPVQQPAFSGTTTQHHQRSPAARRHYRAGYVDDDVDEAPRFLVTGAGGQIGTELLHLLRDRMGPVNVVATDVRHSSDSFTKGPFAYCDVTDKESIARLVVEHRITHIMHLATLLSAVGERNPQLALRVNNMGIQNVLEVAATHNVSVFAPSTIAVFGSTTPNVDTPDETVCEPSTMYGITKVHVELLGKYYADKFGVDFRSLRYPGIISSSTAPGGGTTDYSVEMYIAAVLGKDYVCPIHPDTPLPMMYMPDCLRATWQLITAPREELTRCTYNVTAMSFTPAQLEASIRNCYPGFKVEYKPDFRQEIASTWPQSIDDSRARADWKWRHRFGIDQMTEDMLAAMLLKYQPEAGGCAVPDKPDSTSAKKLAA